MTRETRFFRHPQDFASLGQLLDEGRLTLPLSIWSAGCATGEEAYTLSFFLADHLGLDGLGEVYLLATDLDEKALEKAQTGLYSPKRVASINNDKIETYFESPAPEKYQVRRRYREAVHFRPHNLLHCDYPLPPQGKWDVIFCRNVLIYFDEVTQQQILSRFHQYLDLHRYLVLGYSEFLFPSHLPFQVCQLEKTYFYERVPKSMGHSKDSQSEKRGSSHRNSDLTVVKTREEGTRKKPEPETRRQPRRMETPTRRWGRKLSTPSLEENSPSREKRKRLHQGHQSFSQGDLWTAVEHYEKAVDDPVLAGESLVYLGVVLYRLDRSDLARRTLDQACKLQPQWALPLYFLALIHQSRSESQLARELFKKTVDLLVGEGVEGEFTTYAPPLLAGEDLSTLARQGFEQERE